MTTQIETGVIVRGADGSVHVFSSKREAEDFLRKPQVQAALDGITKGNAPLTAFILDNKEDILDCLDTGTVRRVTKLERGQLQKALEYAAKLEDKKLSFLVEHADAIVATFKWPNQTRLTGEAKEAAQLESLTELAEGNRDVAMFIVDHIDAIKDAYEAGRVKREVNAKAAEGLAAYRAKKAAEKAAKEAAEAAE